MPQVLVSTGATQFGREYKQYPWTIGWQPDYVSEARIYGLDIKNNHPNAKIAILYQNDSYGKDYLNGFKAALGTAKVKSQVVGEVPYEVTGGPPSSQLARLKATGADTLMIFVTTSATITSYAIIRGLGWKPANIYVNNVSSADVWMTTATRVSSADTVNGSISTGYLKDAAAPRFPSDATVKQYKSLMAKYLPNANVNDGTFFYGFAKALHVRAGDVQGRQEPDPCGSDEGADLVQRGEPVPASRREDQDDAEGPVHALVPAAAAVHSRCLDADRPGARRSAARVATSRHLQGSWGPATAPTSFLWTSPSHPSRS